jgi:hypothetical protein
VCVRADAHVRADAGVRPHRRAMSTRTLGWVRADAPQLPCVRRVNADAGGRPDGNFHPKTSVMTSLLPPRIGLFSPLLPGLPSPSHNPTLSLPYPLFTYLPPRLNYPPTLSIHPHLFFLTSQNLHVHPPYILHLPPY